MTQAPVEAEPSQEERLLAYLMVAIQGGDLDHALTAIRDYRLDIESESLREAASDWELEFGRSTMAPAVWLVARADDQVYRASEKEKNKDAST